MTRSRASLLILVALALVGAGFFAWRSLGRLRPEPPPRGANLHAAPALDSESSLRVPVQVDVGLIEGVADRGVPALLLSRARVDAGDGVLVDLNVRRAGRITAEARRGKLHLRMPVAADIAADWQPEGLVGLVAGGKPQKIRTRAAFTVRAEIGLGVDAQWNLATSTAATLRWDDDPTVQVGPFTVKLRALVGDRIDQQFDAMVHTLDEQLQARVPMRSLVSQAWAAAFRPLAVDEGGDLWLVTRPTAMSLGEVETREGQVSLDVGIHGVLRVRLGDEPAAPPPTPLPPRSAPPREPGVALDVPVSVTFAAANRQLDAQVEGRVLDVPLDVVDRSVPLTIEAIEVYPSGDQIAVALDFSADPPGQWLDVSGRVYLVGTPRLDVQRDQLSIVDLAYDARTDRVLVDVAAWMLHAEIVRRVEALLVFDLEERLAGYREQVNRAIADYRLSDTVRLRGRLDHAGVVRLTVTDAAIVALFQLRGAATLELAPTAARAPEAAPVAP